VAKKSNTNRFTAPAQKYAGQVKVNSGPVPLQRWQKPLTRADHDNAVGSSQGTDMRPERPPVPGKTPPGTRTGKQYNR
jgi:hypothetical protein